MADVEKNQVKQEKNGTEAKTAEPSENDPCIEEKHQPRRILNHAENMLREKTGLSKETLRYVGGLVLVILLLLIIIVALGCAWPSTPHHQLFPVCEDPACLRASAQIRESLDTSTSPCSDIWQWACGKWLVTNNLPNDKGKWNQKLLLEKQESMHIRDLITTLPLPLHTGTLEWKLMYFYEACMDVDTIEIDKERPLMNIISELGGWYVLKNWNLYDFDPMAVLKNLHVNYGATPYFKISIDPNPGSPGNSSIRISPSGLGLPDRAYYYRGHEDPIQQTYKQFISDVVINLGATRSDAETFGNDMFFYEKRIAEITPGTIQLQDPVQTYNTVKISELKIIASSLYLHEILTAMYPESNIDEETDVILTSPDYLTKVSGIVSTTDKSVLNGYMIWTLVKAYLPYISSKFATSWNAFNHELLGIRTPIERWEFCANLGSSFMPLMLNVISEKRDFISDSTKNEVTKVFDAVKNVVQKRLDKFKDVPNLYFHLRNKINKMTLQVGLPEFVQQEEYMKDYYKKMTVIKKSFFTNYRNGVNFMKKMEERRILSHHPEDYVMIDLFSKPSTVHYCPATNQIVIPRTLLLRPYYETNYPMSVIFGRLGVEIAHAFVDSVLPYNSAWTDSSKLLTQFHVSVNESLNYVQRPIRCLLDFINKENLNNETVANLTLLNVIKAISSIDIAEEALLDVIQDKAHIHQPTLEIFEDSAVFYLTYSQTLCSVITERHILYDSITKFNLPSKDLLHILWKQMPSFSETLSCPSPSETQCSDIF